jgi:hypothetical protein
LHPAEINRRHLQIAYKIFSFSAAARSLEFSMAPDPDKSGKISPRLSAGNIYKMNKVLPDDPTDRISARSVKNFSGGGVL